MVMSMPDHIVVENIIETRVKMAKARLVFCLSLFTTPSYRGEPSQIRLTEKHNSLIAR